MSNVFGIDPGSQDPHFNFWVLCLACSHKWVATVHYKAPLFALECSQCQSRDSFPSMIPAEYTNAFTDDDNEESTDGTM